MGKSAFFFFDLLGQVKMEADIPLQQLWVRLTTEYCSFTYIMKNECGIWKRNILIAIDVNKKIK